MNFLALVLARMVESEAGDAGGGFFGDDFQAFDHAGNDFMLNAGVKALGIFTNDDQVNVRIASRNVRKIANGPEVCVELEALAQLDVNAGKAAADRRRHRTLQSDARSLDRIVEVLRNVFLVFLESLGASHEGFPLELEAGGFENADDGIGDFGANAVAGNEGNAMGHKEMILAGAWTSTSRRLLLLARALSP